MEDKLTSITTLLKGSQVVYSILIHKLGISVVLVEKSNNI